jgi:predicted nucleic acid-binding protein
MVESIYNLHVGRNDTLCTSVFTVGEVLALPMKMKDTNAIASIRDSMLNGEVELISFTLSMAERYAQIRAGTNLKAADALHLATAIEINASLFVTNDHQLQKLLFPGKPLCLSLEGKIS